jgi:hypothetical protein
VQSSVYKLFSFFKTLLTLISRTTLVPVNNHARHIGAHDLTISFLQAYFSLQQITFFSKTFLACLMLSYKTQSADPTFCDFGCKRNE